METRATATSLEVEKALGVGPGAALAGGQAAPTSGEPLLSLDRAMARHIEVALARARGKIEGPGGAAALLGINPHTLRARMRKLGVDWRRHRAG